MNKAIVINQEGGSVTQIECIDNKQALEVYNALIVRHCDLKPHVSFFTQLNAMLIFSDGSILNSEITVRAEPDVYLPVAVMQA